MHHHFKFLIKILAIAMAYFITAMIGLKFATFSNTSPIWPASGLAIGSMIIFGYKIWPAILIGSLLANYLIPTELLPSLSIAIGNTLESILGLAIIKQVNASSKIANIHKKQIALILASIIPPLVAAIFGIASLYSVGKIPANKAFEAWLTWASGDAVGILAIVPFFYLLKFEKEISIKIPRLLTTIFLVSLISYFIFIHNSQFFWIYALFPICLICIIFTHQISLMISILIICLLSASATSIGIGPFVGGPFHHDIVTLQVFLTSLLLTSLTFVSIRSSKSFKLPLYAITTCWLLAGLIAFSFKEKIDREEQTNFNQIVKTTYDNIQNNIHTYENVLKSGAGYLQAIGELDREKWRNFVASLNIAERFPGILSMGVIHPVKESELESFIKKHQLKEGLIDFGKDNKLASLQDHYIITHVEPEMVAKNIRGLNLGLEPKRRNALELARDNGQGTSTGQITLIKEKQDTEGFLFIQAVYKQNSKLHTSEDRRNSLKSFIYAAAKYNNFFRRPFSSARINDIEYAIFDGDDIHSKNIVYSNISSNNISHFDLVKKLQIGGKYLTISWRYSSTYVHSGQRTAAWIILAGTAFSALISSLIMGFQTIYNKAEEIAHEQTQKLRETEKKIIAINRELESKVNERTHELQDTLRTLKLSEENFRNLADSLPQIVWITGPSGESQYLNKRWYEFSGLNPDNNTLSNDQVVHPDDLERVQAQWKRAMEEKEPFETQLRLWDYREKHYKWFLSRSIPVLDNTNGTERWFGTSTDIHHHKILELEQRKLSTLVENSPDFIILFDEAGKINYANSSAYLMLGLSETHEQNIAELFRDSDLYKSEISSWLKKYGSWEKEALLKNSVEDYDIITFTHIFVIKSHTSEDPTVHALVARDISDIKSAELERHDFSTREQAALEASRLKSIFVANMSHEIRTPISGILGLTNILKKTPLSIEQKELLSSLEQSGRTLLDLINDILDLSKIESGKFDIERINFSLLELINITKKHFEPSASEKNIHIRLNLEPGLVDLVSGDPLRLKQIFMNLISNAIKFSEDGEITITGYMLSQNSEKIEVHFSVKDEGIGISQETLAILFAPFNQADSSTTRKYGGTGLGLSISKHLVEMMNGQIGAQSNLGKGSVFWFKLELRPPIGSLSNEPKSQLTSLSGTRVIAAEDNPVNQKIIIHNLKELGANAKIVNNGKELIDELIVNSYDIILMDCQMPIMDGYEASRRIRQGIAGLDSKETPIIALTANALKGDKESCLAAGMNDFLSKPVSAEDLCHVIMKWTPSISHKSEISPMTIEDKQLANELIAIFLVTGPESLSKIMLAFEMNQLENFNFEVHKFKSSLLALDFHEAAKICTQIEQDIRMNDKENLSSRLLTLERLVNFHIDQLKA